MAWNPSRRAAHDPRNPLLHLVQGIVLLLLAIAPVCGDRRAALKLVNGNVRLRLLLDRVSVDVFGGDGCTCRCRTIRRLGIAH
jgi:hypothetical protein